MNEWNQKRVFISGGAGVIGTALVERLINLGARILVGDLKPMPSAWKNHVQYRHGDLNTLTKEEIQAFSPEIFFHLAATFERSEETYEFWNENFHHNILLSHHLASLLKDQPFLSKVIFASSYLIYDPSQYLFDQPPTESKKLKETSKIYPRNLCGMSKLLHEQELQFLKNFLPNLQAVNARIFRSYGKNSRDIISRWIRSLLAEETITLYRPEGKFDFIYAEDVAEGLLHLATSGFSGSVNLGSGYSRSIEEVIGVLSTHFKTIKIKREVSSIPCEASQADMELFIRLTGWNHFQTLEDTIPKIIDFESQRL